MRMSESRGALVSVTGSSVRSAAGISVRQAFLAPEIGIEPISRWPPCTRMLSILPVYPCLSLSPRPTRARFCALRRARFARSAAASRRDFSAFGAFGVFGGLLRSGMAAFLPQAMPQVQNTGRFGPLARKGVEDRRPLD